MEQLVEYLLWATYFFSLFFVIFWLTTFITEREVKTKKRLKELPNVTIIVPAYNEEAGIKDTLGSLARLDYPRDKLEIIAVNDGSKDQTAARAREAIKEFQGTDIKLINQENAGKGAAMNAGIRQAKGEYVVCMDADSIIPDKKALHKMLPYFSSEEIAAVLPCLKVGETKNLLQKMQRYEYLVNMFYKELMGRLDCIKVTPGPFAVYRKDVLLKIGGFDEVFNRHLTEDLEIALRLQKNNYKIVQTMETDVLTIPPNNLKEFYQQRKRWYKGGFLNTLRYKKMILDRKFGDFGLFEMPTTLISGFIMIALLFSMAYYLAKPALQAWAKLSSINFDIWTLLKKISWDISALDFHYGLIFVGIVMACASIFVIKRSHAMAKEKVFRYGALPFVFYIAMYFILLAVGWVVIYYELIRKKEMKW